MHELAIAESIAAIAREHAHGRRVVSVAVRVGHLRQVVPSSLRFAFELVAAQSELEGARLEIEAVPAAAVCRSCGAEVTIDRPPLACSACGRSDLLIKAGEELTVESLEVEEGQCIAPK